MLVVGAYGALAQFAHAKLEPWTAVLVIHVLQLRIVAGGVLEKCSLENASERGRKGTSPREQGGFGTPC